MGLVSTALMGQRRASALLLGPTRSISVFSAGYVCCTSFSMATSARSGFEKGMITLTSGVFIIMLLRHERDLIPQSSTLACIVVNCALVDINQPISHSSPVMVLLYIRAPVLFQGCSQLSIIHQA